jgi:hypothetical protein
VKAIDLIFWLDPVRALPSWVLFYMVILGAAWVVVATSLHSLKRAREDKVKVGERAKVTLRPEIAKNIALVKKMRDGFHNGSGLIKSLDVRAWERISMRGSLFALRIEDINKLIRVYGLIYRTNIASDRLLESATVTASTLSNGRQIHLEYLDNIRTTLDELQPALEELTENL